jgi:chorismate dehydratase
MLRVGSVPYLVARPLDLGLDEEAGIELVQAPPAELVEGLRQGRLDVALVSSIELFRRPGYAYLDVGVIGGAGFVSSVQVFLRRPVQEVESVALDPASRTAAALTQVVWPRAERPRFLETGPGGDPRLHPTDAWLRIGDQALLEYANAGGLGILNPSQEWRRITDLPFAFALWIVRPGAPVEPHLSAFRRARARGGAALERLASEACARWRIPAELTRRYLFEECRFDLGAELAPVLRTFRDRSARLGLACADLEPQPIPCAG